MRKGATTNVAERFTRQQNIIASLPRVYWKYILTPPLPSPHPNILGKKLTAFYLQICKGIKK